ncbi:endonuclease [Bacillus mycoides]|nr:endonuclease [Bacillus mycoides]
MGGLFIMKKTCTVCGENKLLEEFAKDKAKKDGCRNQCKNCINLRKRKTPIIPKPKQGHKHCAKCRREKQLSEFNIRSVNGRKRIFSYCKECERKYNNNRYDHTCTVCNKKYKSGRKDSSHCKECHDKYMVKTYSILHKLDFNGENNPMYGRQRFGQENPNYNPNKTDEEREKERLVEGYGIWRTKVYERDNYTCRCCGYDKGSILVAHHLDGWDWCKKKRLDVDNGVTLCKRCHKQFHDKYGYGHNTRQQFITYMNESECSV